MADDLDVAAGADSAGWPYLGDDLREFYCVRLEAGELEDIPAIRDDARRRYARQVYATRPSDLPPLTYPRPAPAFVQRVLDIGQRIGFPMTWVGLPTPTHDL